MIEIQDKSNRYRWSNWCWRVFWIFPCSCVSSKLCLDEWMSKREERSSTEVKKSWVDRWVKRWRTWELILTVIFSWKHDHQYVGVLMDVEIYGNYMFNFIRQIFKERKNKLLFQVSFLIRRRHTSYLNKKKVSLCCYAIVKWIWLFEFTWSFFFCHIWVSFQFSHSTQLRENKDWEEEKFCGAENVRSRCCAKRSESWVYQKWSTKQAKL